MRKDRERWVIVAKSRETGKIIDFQVGRRNKKKLGLVINKLLHLNPKAIYTDGYNGYQNLMPKEIHKVVKRGTNHVERFNLTLRTHICRLNRKSICYTKNTQILEYILKIYLWG